jgi:hypothetical protein
MSTLKSVNLQHPSSATPNISLDSSANVGIGTGSPTQKLDVYGASGVIATTVRSAGSTGSDQAYTVMQAGSNTAYMRQDGDGGTFISAPSSLATFVNSSERMRIDSSGNVGIGTSSPATKLTIGALGALRLQTGSVTMDCTPTAGATDSFVWNSSVNCIYSWSMAGSERARIDSSGNLLVGTTSQYDSNRLTIAVANNGIGVTGNSGSTAYTANGTGNYNFGLMRINGTSYGSITVTTGGTAYNTSSDYRLKHDVQPIADGLSTVAALKPVTYKWNIDNSVGEGFIAHELQSIIPLAVSGEKDEVNADGSIKAQGVDYSKIVVHLVAAIQELKAQNDELKARVAVLEAK